MNRRPQYADNRNFRIISAPNGLWIAQHLIPFPDGTPVKTFDAQRRPKPQLNPWNDLYPLPESHSDATTRMNRAAKVSA